MRHSADILVPMTSQEGVQEITGLLRTWREGNEDALNALLPLVYRRLKKIAGHLMRGQRQGGPLETTALVHEGYLRLLDLERIGWQDRTHFFAISARIMRQVLVDRARYENRTASRRRNCAIYGTSEPPAWSPLTTP